MLRRDNGKIGQPVYDGPDSLHHNLGDHRAIHIGGADIYFMDGQRYFGMLGLGKLMKTILAVLLLFSTVVFTTTPGNDLGTGLYLGVYQGGLYENGSNAVPSDHEADGLAAASQITPLDVNGNPSAQGKIVFLSMGMSNAAIEFYSFEQLAKGTYPSSVVLWNGAKSDQDEPCFTAVTGPAPCQGSPENEYDRISSGLAASHMSNLQVQAAWIDNANGRFYAGNRGCLPAGTLCQSLCSTPGCTNTYQSTDAVNLEWEFGENLRAAKQRFPNLKMVFFSGRVFGGWASQNNADPEPFAFEKFWSIKWLIQAQVNQQRGLGVDQVAGDLSYDSSPWIAWGPYFWADGTEPRSDGLEWPRDLFDSSGLHLTVAGGQQAGQLLLNFMRGSEFTKWFN